MDTDARTVPDERDAGAAELARATLAKLDTVTDRLVEAIVTENPRYYRSQQVSEPDLRASCRANIERVLQLIGQCTPEGEDAYDAARRTGRKRAEQRVPLDLVLRSFRLGGRVVWSNTLEAARGSERIDQELLLEIATSVWTVVDEVSSVVSDNYRRAELEVLRADEQQRRALIDSLLHGTEEEAGSAESQLRALGLPANASYLVVVNAADDGPVDPVHREEMLARHGVSSAWQARPAALVGIVAVQLDPVEALTRVLAENVPGRVGLSPGVTSAAELPRAHEWARLALRTVPPGTTGTATLDERLPQALVARSPALAERLVHRALGPLLELPEQERDVLLATLASWLAADRSAKLAATRLFCHRNTVLNRLARIESVLGRSINGVEEAVWLRLALDARRLHPS
ncbi:helix-turn-helix domain-containing protein [Salinifilum aidingensis]